MAKGKKKSKKKDESNKLTEVDKEFYELTIADANRKIERLTNLSEELEKNNDELTEQIKRLDEERNDIIMYLKRTLQEKIDEIIQLNERIVALEESISGDNEEFKKKIEELENEYKQKHEELTSDIKLLESKLNALEEFRSQREQLIQKYNEQQIYMEEQEVRHKEEMDSVERKFIIGKDKLKKDMEARLLQLSVEFQAKTEAKIASTTHRVIRENIAIDNELIEMLNTTHKLHSQNLELKKRFNCLKKQTNNYDKGNREALKTIKEQTETIHHLKINNKNLQVSVNKYLAMEEELNENLRQLKCSKQNVDNLKHRIRVLEQNMHGCTTEITQLKYDLVQVLDEKDYYAVILFEITDAIKHTLLRMEEESFEARCESLIQLLCELILEAKTKKRRRTSIETIPSISKIYRQGELGVELTSATILRPMIVTKRNFECQTAASFDKYLADIQISQETVTIGIVSSDVKGEEASILEEEKRSTEEIIDKSDEDVLSEEDEDQDEEEELGEEEEEKEEKVEGKGRVSIKQSSSQAKQETTSKVNVVQIIESKDSKCKSSIKISESRKSQIKSQVIIETSQETIEKNKKDKKEDCDQDTTTPEAVPMDENTVTEQMQTQSHSNITLMD